MASAYAPPGSSPADPAWSGAYESFPDIGKEDRPPRLFGVLGASCMDASSRFASLFPCAAVDLHDTDDGHYATDGFCRQDTLQTRNTEKEERERWDPWDAAVAEVRGLSERAEALERLAAEYTATSACALRKDAAAPTGHYGFIPAPEDAPAMEAEEDVCSVATMPGDNSLVWDGASSEGSPERDRPWGRTTVVAFPPCVNASDSDSGIVDGSPPRVDAPPPSPPLESRGASELSVEVLPTPSPTSPPTKRRKGRFGRRLFGRKKKA